MLLTLLLLYFQGKTRPQNTLNITKLLLRHVCSFTYLNKILCTWNKHTFNKRPYKKNFQMSTLSESYLSQQINLKWSRSTVELCNFNKQHVIIAVIHRLQKSDAFTEDTPLMKRFKLYLRLAGQRRRWQILRSRKLLPSQSMSGEPCLHSQLLWLLPTPGTRNKHCFSAFFSIKYEETKWKGKLISEVLGHRWESTGDSGIRKLCWQEWKGTELTHPSWILVARGGTHNHSGMC